MTEDQRRNEGALQRMYKARRAEEDPAWRERVWQRLVDRIFQPYVEAGDTVLDLGAGWGEFTNAIRCARKIAVDLNPDTARHVRDAEVIVTSATDLSPIATGSVDLVFCSNVLEHLESPEAVVHALRESRRVLRAGGTAIALVPNVRYLPGRFWDYLDHRTPLTDQSLAEAFALAGFDVTRIVPKFTPYETKSRLIPRSVLLVEIYLRLPLLWRIFGKQAIVVGRAL